MSASADDHEAGESAATDASNAADSVDSNAEGEEKSETNGSAANVETEVEPN